MRLLAETGRNGIRRIALGLLAGLVLALYGLIAAAPADAQQFRNNRAGDFDFYVLALSWSPAFCEAQGERARGPQCARSYSFIVHGLWPQYDRGFPEYCQQPAEEVDNRTIRAMFDLMPAPGLIRAEWRKHGTCSGLSQRAYFEAVRQARAAVRIPSLFADVTEPRNVTPAEVEEAFLKENPGLTADAIAVTCDGHRLREVRVCLSKDLRFRNCPEVDRRACRRDKLVITPLRGGT